MPTDEELAKAVEANGIGKYGEAFGKGLAAINETGGVDQEIARRMLHAPNSHDHWMALGRDRLIQQASDGDRNAEFTVSAIREAERKAYRTLKGRS
jgi:hypothetical protein